MDDIYYLNYFRNNFKNYITYYPNLLNNYNLDNNVIIYGKDDLSNICISEFLLKKYLQIDNIKYKNLQFNQQISYNVSNYNLQININNIQSSNRKYIIDFIKDISSTKPLISKYHIFCIDNFDLLHPQLQSSLRRLIESKQHLTIFILTTTNINNIDLAIQSRFLCLRIPVVRYLQLEDMIKKMLFDTLPTTFNDFLSLNVKAYVKKYNYNLMNCLLNLESFVKNNFNIESKLETMNHSNIETEIATYFTKINRIKNISSLMESTRNLVKLILKYNYSDNYICNVILNHAISKTKCNIKKFAIINTIANINCNMIYSMKLIFHYELLIIRC